MEGTVAGFSVSMVGYRNRLVVTGPAAQLRMSDRQMVIRCLAGVLAAALLTLAPPSQATPWPACNTAGLSPPAAIARPTPPYPESARQAGAEGFVDVAFTILRDGRVGWIRILKAQPQGFFEPATLDGIRDWRFEPARREGQPVECRIQTRVRYTLADTVAARRSGSAAVGDQPAPVYPDQARIEGLEGYVEVEFEVGADGRVTDARVTLAMPRGPFEQAALDAIRRWRLPPGTAGGPPATRRFDFSLPDAYPHEPRPTLLAAAPLPPAACAQRTPGRVMLEVEVDAEGRITASKILDSRPAGLYEATALAIARNSRLEPAYRGGVPIPATALLTLRFEPDEARCGSGDPGDPRAPARSRATPRVGALAPDAIPSR
jgi:TonB family protein